MEIYYIIGLDDDYKPQHTMRIASKSALTAQDIPQAFKDLYPKAIITQETITEQTFKCPDGLSCSGDGSDCVGARRCAQQAQKLPQVSGMGVAVEARSDMPAEVWVAIKNTVPPMMVATNQYYTGAETRYVRADLAYAPKAEEDDFQPPKCAWHFYKSALEQFIYETTHLSPQREDGSHDCRISSKCLVDGRVALEVLKHFIEKHQASIRNTETNGCSVADKCGNNSNIATVNAQLLEALGVLENRPKWCEYQDEYGNVDLVEFDKDITAWSFDARAVAKRARDAIAAAQKAGV